MSGLGRLTVVAFAIFATCCTHDGWNGMIDPADRPAVKTPFPEISDWRTVRIRFDRLCGIVACGLHRVEILGDGTVIFDDKLTSHVPSSKVRALVRKFQRAEFFWADSFYGPMTEDAGLQDISIAFDGREKAIHLEGSGPQEIFQLMDEIDRTAGTDAFLAARRRGRY